MLASGLSLIWGGTVDGLHQGLATVLWLFNVPLVSTVRTRHFPSFSELKGISANAV